MSKYLDKVLFQLFPIISFYIYALPELINSSLVQALGFILAIPYLFRYISHNKINYWLLLLLLSLTFGSLINLLNTRNGIGGTLVVITTLSLSLFCLDNLRQMRFHIFMVLLYTLIFLATNIFIFKTDPNEIYLLQGYSRNHGGFLLILWVSFYGFVQYIMKSRVVLFWPLLAFFLSFFLVGRSSMGILLILCVLLLLKKSGKYAILSLTVILVLIFYFKNFFIDAYELTSFHRKSMDTQRYDIWYQYLHSIDGISFFLGADTMSIPLIASFDGNTHNSFLKLHSRTGIFGFIVVIYLLVVSSCKFIKNKKYIPLLFLLAVCSRIFFDNPCFVGPHDFVLYTMMLYPSYKTPN